MLSLLFHRCLLEIIFFLISKKQSIQMKTLTSIFCFLTLAAFSQTRDTISTIPENAWLYVGKTVIVCGDVVTTSYNPAGQGKPTYLNFSKDYPANPFAAFIWSDDLHLFKHDPQVWYKGKRVCVTGEVIDYKGKPEMNIRDEKQVEVK
jgi:hypothetical protein